VLLPYNSLLTAQPYFQCNAFKGMGFPFTSMLFYSSFLSISQVFLIFGGDSLSLRIRLRLAFISAFLICALLVVWSFLAREWPNNAVIYGLTLATVAALGLSNSLMQTAVLGVAGTIGPQMSAAVMVGLGFCGLLSLGTSLLVQAIESWFKVEEANGDSGLWVSVILFLEAILVTVLSVWVYFSYLAKRNAQSAAVIAGLENQRKGRGAEGPSVDPGIEAALTTPTPNGTSDSSTPRSESAWARGAAVLKDVAPQALNVFGVFLLTMTIFPGVMLAWTPGDNSFFHSTDVEKTKKLRLLFQTLLIGTFQVFDVVGRAWAPRVARCVPPQWNWTLVVIRFAFLPLFMLGQRSPEMSFLWGSDEGRFVLITLVGLTNGLCASLAMMSGPLRVEDARREVAGMAMSCVMVCGIFAGTLCALLTQIGIPAASGDSC